MLLLGDRRMSEKNEANTNGYEFFLDVGRFPTTIIYNIVIYH